MNEYGSKMAGNKMKQAFLEALRQRSASEHSSNKTVTLPVGRVRQDLVKQVLDALDRTTSSESDDD
jgi:hypothetical protein